MSPLRSSLVWELSTSPGQAPQGSLQKGALSVACKTVCAHRICLGPAGPREVSGSSPFSSRRGTAVRSALEWGLSLLGKTSEAPSRSTKHCAVIVPVNICWGCRDFSKVEPTLWHEYSFPFWFCCSSLEF